MLGLLVETVISSNTVTIDQTDTASTNVANIVSTTSNGTINVDQCASGC